MEVRKHEICRSPRLTKHAETLMATTGVVGGESINIGRAAERLIGVGPSSMGFDQAVPYELTGDSSDPRVRFAFAGIDGPRIGDHGRLGGAVVFQEWDRTDPARGTPAHTLAVARSGKHSVTSELYGASKDPNHAEMAFFETTGGGAVFSVASMAWCAALRDNDYDNDVARLTGNVLDRFLAPAPFDFPSAAADRKETGR
jgi:N,N-dimethylformamidase